MSMLNKMLLSLQETTDGIFVPVITFEFLFKNQKVQKLVSTIVHLTSNKDFLDDIEIFFKI